MYSGSGEAIKRAGRPVTIDGRRLVHARITEKAHEILRAYGELHGLDMSECIRLAITEFCTAIQKEAT